MAACTGHQLEEIKALPICSLNLSHLFLSGGRQDQTNSRQLPAQLKQAVSHAVAHIGVSPARCTLPWDTASSSRAWHSAVLCKETGASALAAAHAEATLAPELLTQVTGIIAAPTEMLSQVFLTGCTTAHVQMIRSHERASEAAFPGWSQPLWLSRVLQLKIDKLCQWFYRKGNGNRTSQE